MLSDTVSASAEGSHATFPHTKSGPVPAWAAVMDAADQEDALSAASTPPEHPCFLEEFIATLATPATPVRVWRPRRRPTTDGNADVVPTIKAVHASRVRFTLDDTVHVVPRLPFEAVRGDVGDPDGDDPDFCRSLLHLCTPACLPLHACLRT